MGSISLVNHLSRAKETPSNAFPHVSRFLANFNHSVPRRTYLHIDICVCSRVLYTKQYAHGELDWRETTSDETPVLQRWYMTGGSQRDCSSFASHNISDTDCRTQTSFAFFTLSRWWTCEHFRRPDSTAFDFIWVFREKFREMHDDEQKQSYTVETIHGDKCKTFAGGNESNLCKKFSLARNKYISIINKKIQYKCPDL